MASTRAGTNKSRHVLRRSRHRPTIPQAAQNQLPFLRFGYAEVGNRTFSSLLSVKGEFSEPEITSLEL